MQAINPILALAGAAASVGCRMFASELVDTDTGRADAQRYIEGRPHWAGISAVSVGQIIDRTIKTGEHYVAPTVDLFE